MVQMLVIKTQIGTSSLDCLFMSFRGRAYLVVLVGNRIAAGRDLEKQEK